MKKIILLASLLLCGFVNAQISALGNGEQITDGKVFIFSGLTVQSATLALSVTNTSEENLNLKLKVKTISPNASGRTTADIQFCFGGICFFDINEGSMVPPNTNDLILAPGESNATGDHFSNHYMGDDPSLPIEYELSFVQVDDEHNQIGDDLLTFTYKYEPELSVEDFNSLKNIGITINNSVIKSTLDMNSTINAKLNVYSINGQLVKTSNLTVGQQSIDFSDLNNAIYIARFTTEDNKTSQVRVVKN